MSGIVTDSLVNTRSLLSGHTDTHQRCLLLGPAQPELSQPLWSAWHGLGMQRENHLCCHGGVQQLPCQEGTERGHWSSCQRLLGRDFPVPPGPHTLPGFARGLGSGGCTNPQQIQLLKGRSLVLKAQTFSTTCTGRHSPGGFTCPFPNPDPFVWEVTGEQELC